MKRSLSSSSPSPSPSVTPSASSAKKLRTSTGGGKGKATKLSDIEPEDNHPIRSFSSQNVISSNTSSSGTSTLLATRPNGSSFMRPRTLNSIVENGLGNDIGQTKDSKTRLNFY